MARRRFTALVHGRVQGVGFRYFISDIARELGLSGFVRNRSDGIVEVVAEGEEATLRLLLYHMNKGPRNGNVEEVEVEWSDPADVHDAFYIRR